MSITLPCWPPPRDAVASPWSDGIEAGDAALRVQAVCRAAGVRCRSAFVTRLGDGGPALFWRRLFDHVDVLAEANTDLTILHDGPHRALCGRALSPSRFRIRDALGELDALIIDAEHLPDAMASYFLFRRRLAATAAIFFVQRTGSPGAGRLVPLLAEGALDGERHRIAEVAAHAAGGSIMVEVVSNPMLHPTPPGAAPVWQPLPDTSLDTSSAPNVQTVLDALHGHRVFRWYGCFLAVRHGAQVGDGEDVFDLAPADCRVEPSIRTLIKALSATADAESRPSPQDPLAASLTTHARSAPVAVWGMGSDLLRAIIGCSGLRPYFQTARIRIVDRNQIGREFCGQRVLAPEELADSTIPAILTPRSVGTRAAIRAEAVAMGMAPNRLVDPYE